MRKENETEWCPGAPGCRMPDAKGGGGGWFASHHHFLSQHFHKDLLINIGALAPTDGPLVIDDGERHTRDAALRAGDEDLVVDAIAEDGRGEEGFGVVDGHDTGFGGAGGEDVDASDVLAFFEDTIPDLFEDGVLGCPASELVCAHDETVRCER